jgi:DNA-binding transcriptional MocR family regulator
MTVPEISQQLDISVSTVTQRARALLAEGKIRQREGRDWIFDDRETALLMDFIGRERERKKYTWKTPAAPVVAPKPQTAAGYGVRVRRYADGAVDVPVGE